MQTKNILFSIIVLFMFSCTNNKVPEFDHYGVYLKTEDGFVELKKNLQTDLLKVEIEDELVIYVFSPQAKEMQCDLYEGRSRSIENNIAPVGDYPEIIKISAPAGDIFGGLISFNVKENGRYFVELVNEDTKKSLIRWMEKNIELIDVGKYADFYMNFIPKEVKTGITDEDKERFLKEIQENPKALEEIKELKSELSEHLEKLKEEKGVKFMKNLCRICIGSDCYEFMGKGNWHRI